MTEPKDVVRAMFAHHLWATSRLIDHLEDLPRERLDDAVPGTYGSILATLTHLVDADGRYLLRLTSASPPPYVDGGARPLATLRAELDEHGERWGAFIDLLEAGTLQASITGREDYPDTHDAEGLLLLQAVHHGNDHRTQVCSTLGALGADVPDLDGWAYWAEGR
jgi:uncharacterized damage-inducible protein DinB